jgi:hypothetical protein
MGVDGRWYNQIGSFMELIVDGATLRGTYRPAVGNESTGVFKLAGRIDTEPNPIGQALGFVISWKNTDSGNSHVVTTWSGQYQEIDGQEMITAFWLVTRETAPSNDWLSTYIGQDIFTRTEPMAAASAAQRKRGPASHPFDLPGANQQ